MILDEMIHVLPEVARSVAEPLAKTEKMVFVGSGNSGGGPSNFTKEMNRMVAEVPETVHALTGFDMRQGIADFVGGKTRGNVTE